MANLEIKRYPHPILRKKARPLTRIDEQIITLIDDMAHSMYAFRGLGLAAPQVGILSQIIITDIGTGLLNLVNPVLLESEGEDRMEEGCLSFPGIMVEISRPFRVLVKGIDKKEKEVQIEAEGLLARVIQHEIDHLHGKLIIDRVSPLHRELIKNELKKMKRKKQ